LLALAACTVVPARSLWALRQFDAMTFDPAQFRVAARLPRSIGIPADAVAVDLKVERGATGELIEQRLWLQPLAGTESWPGPQREGSVWALLGFDEADQRRILQLRHRAAAWKAADAPDGGKNKMSVSMHAQPCLHGAAPFDGEARVSAWLIWAAQPGWLALLDDEPLGKLLGDKPPPLRACTA
jgi:hypothetical protein